MQVQGAHRKKGSEAPQVTNDPSSAEPTATAALGLLKIEASIREAETVPALRHVLANEIRKAVRARQVFVVDSMMRVGSVSSLPTVDRNAPMIHGLETGLRGLRRSCDFAESFEFDLAQLQTVLGPNKAAVADYPFHCWLWVPIAHAGQRPFAGLLLARDGSWTEYDAVIAKRLAATGGHAWSALHPKVTRPSRYLSTRIVVAAGLITLALLMLVPVPMAVLAPFEIIPRDASVVTAPIEGVIASVEAVPNERVSGGVVLVRYTDTELRNSLTGAEQQFQVADARLKRANQLAFETLEGRRELAIAQAEREVRRAERAFARELLDRSVVRAPRAGLAVFNDPKDMIGRPVKIGERLMDIADPVRVQARLEVPVADGYILSSGSEVRLFLDSEPLAPRAGTVTRADFRAEAHTADRVAFRAYVTLIDESKPPPRLGIRGTAQVYGEPVPLGLFLFRRPVSKVRQWLGL